MKINGKWLSVLIGMVFLIPSIIRAKSDGPEMKIKASFETYYKTQSNYRTAMDSYAGTGLRHGPNNRASLPKFAS